MLPGELWGEILFANLVGRYIFSREVTVTIYIFSQMKFSRLKQKLYFFTSDHTNRTTTRPNKFNSSYFN